MTDFDAFLLTFRTFWSLDSKDKIQNNCLVTMNTKIPKFTVSYCKVFTTYSYLTFWFGKAQIYRKRGNRMNTHILYSQAWFISDKYFATFVVCVFCFCFPLCIHTCMCVLSGSVVSDSFATLWTVGCQAPLSVGFFQARILEWVAISCPRDLPNPGIECASPALQMPSGKPHILAHTHMFFVWTVWK